MNIYRISPSSDKTFVLCFQPLPEEADQSLLPTYQSPFPENNASMEANPFMKKYGYFHEISEWWFLFQDFKYVYIYIYIYIYSFIFPVCFFPRSPSTGFLSSDRVSEKLDWSVEKNKIYDDTLFRTNSTTWQSTTWQSTRYFSLASPPPFPLDSSKDAGHWTSTPFSRCSLPISSEDHALGLPPVVPRTNTSST